LDEYYYLNSTMRILYLLTFIVLCNTCIPILPTEFDLTKNHNCITKDPDHFVGAGTASSRNSSISRDRAETEARANLLSNIEKTMKSECRNILFDNAFALEEYIEHCDSIVNAFTRNQVFQKKVFEISSMESEILEKLDNENIIYYNVVSCCRANKEKFFAIFNSFQSQIDTLKEK